MQSSLGIYIEDNIIKYAKVSRDKDFIKVENFGIKFYDNIEQSIEQILQETYSYNIPKSINVSNENYNYFDTFKILTKKDIDSSVKTAFEIYCEDNNIRINILESRYFLVDDPENPDKLKAIYISAPKAEITEKLQQLKGKVTTITPTAVSISNLINKSINQNAIIINLENKTDITIIKNGQVDRVIKLEKGIAEILNKLYNKLNSYSKAYEVLKATTLYTEMGKDLVDTENSEYLEYIMPDLYDIILTIKEQINYDLLYIDDVYITGMGASINNVDLYFNEYLSNVKCQILKPYFLENISITDINIKDYIEANSAICLALEGLELGNKQINFTKGSKKDFTKKEAKSKAPRELKNNILLSDFDFNFDNIEKILLRLIISVIIAIIVYIVFLQIIYGKLLGKSEEVDNNISSITNQIELVKLDESKLQTKENNYITKTNELIATKEELIEKYKSLNRIPNFLTEMMSIIPKEVKLTSLKVPTANTIELEAQSAYKEQIAVFIMLLKNHKDAKGELAFSNIKSTTLEQSIDSIKIKITGELN